jgi:oxygen-dependent protoporphyrinogen oxidase
MGTGLMDGPECGGGRVAVIGGGITGLAAAHRLREIDPRLSVAVLEAGSRPGGVLRTTRSSGFLVESSADSFLTAVPWGLGLCRRIGLEDRLVPTDPDRRRAFVARRGRLVPIPEGLMVMAPSRLGPILTTPILSAWGKLRLAAERFVPRGSGQDESLASFAVRRFGREAFERLIQPLVSGMYTGDPQRLSIEATLPRFLEMERQWGSLIRAVRRDGAGAGSGARYGLFVAPQGGMGEIVESLAGRLPAGSLRLGTEVERLDRSPDGGWLLRLRGVRRETLAVDAVIVATPARIASRLLRGIDAGLAGQLGRIESAGCAVVSLAYRREQVRHKMDGFGFVVPLVERSPILSGSFASRKFPDRSPEDSVLVRVFLGGACREDLLELADEALVETAHRELSRLLGLRGGPILRHLDRWPEVMPQYHVGHLDLVNAIEAREAGLPGLALAGNAYRGVGVPHCIRSGEQAAERMAARLRQSLAVATRVP